MTDKKTSKIMNPEVFLYKMPNGKLVKLNYERAVKEWQSGKFGTGFELKRKES